jgi:hypothetical protein
VAKAGNAVELGVVFHDPGQFIEEGVVAGEDLDVLTLEGDVLNDADVLLVKENAGLVGAAVVILEAVVGLGEVGAAVAAVDEAVAVVVGVRAAVVVLEAVLVFRGVGAAVAVVGDAVAVAVRGEGRGGGRGRRGGLGSGGGGVEGGRLEGRGADGFKEEAPREQGQQERSGARGHEGRIAVAREGQGEGLHFLPGGGTPRASP